MRSLGVLTLRRGDLLVQLDPAWHPPVAREPKPFIVKTQEQQRLELEAEQQRHRARGLRGVRGHRG